MLHKSGKSQIQLEDIRLLTESTKTNTKTNSTPLWFIAGLALGISIGVSVTLLWLVDKNWGGAKTLATTPPPATTDLATIEAEDPIPTLQQPTRPQRNQQAQPSP